MSLEPSDKFCRLFVGDRLHVVADETLRRFEDSYFSKLLADHFVDNKSKRDIIYIDRDGTHFASILNHLRDSLNLENWTRKALDELFMEADFYCLTELQGQINKEIEARSIEIPTFRCSSVYVLYNSDDDLLPLLKYRNKLTYVVGIMGKSKFFELSDLMTYYAKDIIFDYFLLEFVEVKPDVQPIGYDLRVYVPEGDKMSELAFYEDYIKSKQLTQLLTIDMSIDYIKRYGKKL